MHLRHIGIGVATEINSVSRLPTYVRQVSSSSQHFHLVRWGRTYSIHPLTCKVRKWNYLVLTVRELMGRGGAHFGCSPEEHSVILEKVFCLYMMRIYDFSMSSGPRPARKPKTGVLMTASPSFSSLHSSIDLHTEV